ncbi:MAG: hypothetical protein C4324_05375 [Blastocatellia bacterium]
MRFAIITILAIATAVNAQSGRIRPDATPQPRRPSSAPPPVSSPTPPAPSTAGTDEIRIESTLIPIPATVTDSSGRPVTNLRLEDFELRIDGKPAMISEIRRSEAPIRLALLLDNSSSVKNALEFEKTAAVRFLRRVIRPEVDRAALYSISTVSRLEVPFTTEIGLLTRAISQLPEPAGATALFDGIIAAAKHLTEETGRRVIVLISDGDDTASDRGLEEAIRVVQISNAQVFIVKTTNYEYFRLTRSRTVNANVRQLAAERRMEELARETGGAIFSPIDDDELENAFRNLAARLSEQYVLSYYPDNETANAGQFRAISLSVRGRPDLTVNTRKGYYVPGKSESK